MPLDINAMLQEAKTIANDVTHGYSMYNRLGNPDYDCSSFVAHCIRVGGLPISQYMDTTTEGAELTRVGFTLLPTLDDPQPGDVYFYDEGGGASGHTFFIYDNERIVHASSTKTGDHGSTDPGDQNQEYYGLDPDGYDYHGEICFGRLPYNFSGHTWYHYRYGDIPPIPPTPSYTNKPLPIWLLHKLTKGDFNR